MQPLTGLLAGRTRKAIGLAALMLLVAGAVAIAAPNGLMTQTGAGPQGLVTNGPVNPANGFPDWFRDTNGIDLSPCMNPQDPYCGGAVNAPDNTAPISFPDNFPDEFFYSNATSDGLTSAGGNKVLAEFALEGSFANGPIVSGDQMTFTRIRYKIVDGLKADTDYKITQPYGTDTVHTDAGATGFFVTQDVGAVAGDFAQALKGRVGPFLQWAPNPADPTDVPPAGYLGDGVTPHKVKGSELGTNFVRIQGPGIGGVAPATNPNPCPTTGANAYTGPVLDCIQSDNFTVVGKMSTNGGVDVARASYSRAADGTGTDIQVLASSKADQDIIVRDGDHPTTGRLFPTTPLRTDAGRYMAYVDVPGAMPSTVDVLNRGDSPLPTLHVPVTDALTATAVYHVSNSGGGDVLHVSASSSDKSLPGTELSLPDFGKQKLGTDGQIDVQTKAPPQSVTVASTKGGTVTVPVLVDGEALDALPLLAQAGPDITVNQGAKVTLDGGGSSGDIDSMSWSAPAGVTLTGGDTAKPTFTAPTTATSLTFTLTVTGNGKTETDDVTVTVKPANPARAVIASVDLPVLHNLPLTLDGSGSDGAARYEWSQVDGTPVTLPADTSKSSVTFLYPKTTTPITMRLRVRSASDTGTGSTCVAPTCDTAQITLPPALDNVSGIVAKFDTSKSRWVVSGSASILVSNNVRVYAGASVATGKLIGTALVDPTGAWKIDVRGSSVANTTGRVSIESDRGAKVENVVVG
jgi:hypothetical protein